MTRGVVLQTQVDKGSAIRSFSQDLALFSGTVADNDKYLRSLIDNGSATANELRTFLEQNRVNLGQLINNLVTTGEVIVKHLKGIRQILVHLPLRGGRRLHRGQEGPTGSTTPSSAWSSSRTARLQGRLRPDRGRSPQDLADLPMNTKAGCTDGGKNHRGAEKTPAVAPERPTGHRSRRTMPRPAR